MTFRTPALCSCSSTPGLCALRPRAGAGAPRRRPSPRRRGAGGAGEPKPAVTTTRSRLAARRLPIPPPRRPSTSRTTRTSSSAACSTWPTPRTTRTRPPAGDVPLQRRARVVDDLAAHGVVRPGGGRDGRRAADPAAALHGGRQPRQPDRQDGFGVHRRDGHGLLAHRRARASRRTSTAPTRTSRRSRSSSSARSAPNGRWNSPKFLLGESYGTTRAAALPRLARPEGHGVQRRGARLLLPERLGRLQRPAVLERPALRALPADDGGVGVVPHTLDPKPADLAAFLTEVRGFALGEYAHALAQGSHLDPAEANAVVAKLRHYTAMPESLIRDANLRVDARPLREAADARRAAHGRPARLAVRGHRPRRGRGVARVRRGRRGGEHRVRGGVQPVHPAAR